MYKHTCETWSNQNRSQQDLSLVTLIRKLAWDLETFSLQMSQFDNDIFTSFRIWKLGPFPLYIFIWLKTWHFKFMYKFNSCHFVAKKYTIVRFKYQITLKVLPVNLHRFLQQAALASKPRQGPLLHFRQVYSFCVALEWSQ